MASVKSFEFDTDGTHRDSPLSVLQNEHQEVVETRSNINAISPDVFKVPDVRIVLFDRIVAAKNSLTAIELAQLEMDRELGLCTNAHLTEPYLAAQQELMEANAAILGHLGLSELPLVCPVEEF